MLCTEGRTLPPAPPLSPSRGVYRCAVRCALPHGDAHHRAHRPGANRTGCAPLVEKCVALCTTHRTGARHDAQVRPTTAEAWWPPDLVCLRWGEMPSVRLSRPTDF